MRLIITDVTEMHGGNFCVAGWNAPANRMIRPLPGGGNWTAGLLNQFSISPGVTADVYATAQEHLSAFPHRNEDTIVSVNGTQLVVLKPIDWFGATAPPTATTVGNAFGEQLQYSKVWNGAHQGVHLPENTDANSLNAVRVSAGHLELFEDDYRGKRSLRAYLDDGDACYNLPVVAKSSREAYRANGIAGARQLIPSHGSLHVRLGLARAWSGQPGKCSLMINGIYG